MQREGKCQQVLAEVYGISSPQMHRCKTTCCSRRLYRRVRACCSEVASVGFHGYTSLQFPAAHYVAPLPSGSAEIVVASFVFYPTANASVACQNLRPLGTLHISFLGVGVAVTVATAQFGFSREVWSTIREVFAVVSIGAQWQLRKEMTAPLRAFIVKHKSAVGGVFNVPSLYR